MTAPAFDLGAEVSAATAQQQAAIRLGRAQMAQEVIETAKATIKYASFFIAYKSIIALCEKEAAK